MSKNLSRSIFHESFGRCLTFCLPSHSIQQALVHSSVVVSYWALSLPCEAACSALSCNVAQHSSKRLKRNVCGALNVSAIVIAFSQLCFRQSEKRIWYVRNHSDVSCKVSASDYIQPKKSIVYNSVLYPLLCICIEDEVLFIQSVYLQCYC